MKEKIIILALVVLIGVVVLSTDVSNSVLGKLFNVYLPPDWSQVQERNIVKNSIPITLLEEQGENCIVTAENFDYIIDHQYFKRANQLANELQYDKESKTLMIPCDIIPEKNSKLHVWYATDKAINHSLKYEYFVTSITQ